LKTTQLRPKPAFLGFAEAGAIRRSRAGDCGPQQSSGRVIDLAVPKPLLNQMIAALRADELQLPALPDSVSHVLRLL
jgi:hypothetical protein